MAILKAAERERERSMMINANFQYKSSWWFNGVHFLKLHSWSVATSISFQTLTNQKVVKVTLRFEILALMATFGHHFPLAFFVQPNFCQRRHDDSRSCSTKFESRGLCTLEKWWWIKCFSYVCRVNGRRWCPLIRDFCLMGLKPPPIVLCLFVSIAEGWVPN